MNRTNWFGTFQIRLHSFALAVEIQSGKVYNHTDQGYTEFQSSGSRCSLHALSFTTITKQVATVLVAMSQIPSTPLQITLSMSTTNTLGMPKYVTKSAPSHGGILVPIKYTVHWAPTSPHTKDNDNQFSHFCTAHAW